MGSLMEQIKQILEEIAKGEGAYDTDQLTHAGNCIQNMKQLANKGLKLLNQEVTPQ